MIPYSNLSGDSGVVAYSIGDDFIKVFSFATVLKFTSMTRQTRGYHM